MEEEMTGQWLRWVAGLGACGVLHLTGGEGSRGPAGVPEETYADTGELQGGGVENQAGERIGKVKGFVFLRDSGKLEFVIVQSGGGFLWMGRRAVLVPWVSVQLRDGGHEGRSRVVLDARGDQVRSAPEYREGALDEDAREEVYEFWGVERPPVRAQTSAGS